MSQPSTSSLVSNTSKRSVELHPYTSHLRIIVALPLERGGLITSGFADIDEMVCNATFLFSE